MYGLLYLPKYSLLILQFFAHWCFEQTHFGTVYGCDLRCIPGGLQLLLLILAPGSQRIAVNVSLHCATSAMAKANEVLLGVVRTACDHLAQEVAPSERDGLREFLALMCQSAADGYTKDHPLDHMLTAKHFPGVNLRDPQEVKKILHSFWRCFSDTSNHPQTEGGKAIYYGKFSHGQLEGKVFKFWVNERESRLRAGFQVTDKELLSQVKNMNPKTYCHMASDALRAGQIAGGFGAGLGAYIFEQLYRKVCSDLDHQVGLAEEVTLSVGKSVSIPVGRLVGGNVATFVAGFQSVSMLGPMKFQVCAALCGAGAGLLVAVAITGASTAIGLCETQMMRETEKFQKLAQMAKERREQLEEYVTIMTDDLIGRLKKIASDIGAVGRLIDDADQALKKAVSTIEEALKWSGVAEVAKLGLKQILSALNELEEDVLNHFTRLQRTHASTVAEFREAVRSQAVGDSTRNMIGAASTVLLWLPAGWILCAATNVVSSAVYHARTDLRQQQMEESHRAGVVQELGMLELGIRLLESDELRDKCQGLLDEVKDLMDKGAKELEKIQQAKAKVIITQPSCCTGWAFLCGDGFTSSDRQLFWLVHDLIPVY